MKGNPSFKKIIYYGVLAVALIIIAKYALNPAAGSQASAGNSASNLQESSDKAASNADKNTAENKENLKNSQPANSDIAIKIFKKEVTGQAKFYPYKLDGTNMEVLAIKASDGTIRTALNTCQICYNSGRGYYIQDGDYLVCQNCGNRFKNDQVELVKGGCNPVPIMEDQKQDQGDYITISKDYLAAQKEYFSNWSKV